MAGIEITELDTGTPLATDVTPATDMDASPPRTKKYTRLSEAAFYQSYIAPSVQRFAFSVAESTGADDAFVANLSPVPSALTDGLQVILNTKSLKNLTSTPTLDVNGLGAKDIVIWGGGLLPYDMSPNSLYVLIYNEDNDEFQLINPTMSDAYTPAVQNGSYITFADSGVPNAFVGSLNPAYTSSFGTGFIVCMIPANNNTGLATLTLDGKTHTITNNDGSTLVSGAIVQDRPCWLWFNGDTDTWAVLNSGSNPAVIQHVWAPVIYGSTTAGAPTGTFLGEYVKQGNLVTLFGQIALTNKGGMEGAIRISGIPFPLKSGYNNGMVVNVLRRGDFENQYVVSAQLAGSVIYLLDSENENIAVNAVDLRDNSRFVFQATYLTE